MARSARPLNATAESVRGAKLLDRLDFSSLFLFSVV
jgi:hypothetical protein